MIALAFLLAAAAIVVWCCMQVPDEYEPTAYGLLRDRGEPYDQERDV